jgi:chemotaxis protein CheY-P-specific phosphatase CheC
MGSNTICAFFSAIADFTEIKLVPSPPTLVTDIFESVVDVFLAKMAITAKTALSFQIRLRGEKKTADGILIIFPSPEFQKQLIAAGKRWLSPEPVSAISA